MTEAYHHEIHQNMYQYNTVADVFAVLGQADEGFREELEIHEEFVKEICYGNRNGCGDSTECVICGLFAPCRNELHYHHDGCPTCDEEQ